MSFPKRLLSILLLAATLHVAAQPVSQEEARTKAQAFLSKQQIGASLLKKSAVRAKRQTAATAPYYIFNLENNEGYVIVAGDERATTILGYSMNSSYEEDSLNENLSSWLQTYADEIAWMQRYGVKANDVRPAAASAKNDVASLCTTKWAQSAPYNNKCPYYSGNKRAVTGCVATAIAQVMYFWQHPARPTQVIPAYVSRAYNISMSALSPTDFAWTSMLTQYGTYYEEGNSSSRYQSYNTTQSDAIATLMQYCGAAVEMSYGASSSAYDTSVGHAMKTYFGYDSRTRFVNRRDVTSEQWSDTIYRELQEGRPVIYNGQSSTGGHCFVCDGYQSSTGLYHFNFGWGGQSNGYYALTAVPSSGTSGYNKMQSITIGIQPATEGGDDIDGEGLTVSELTIVSGHTISRTARSADGDIVLSGVMRNNTGKTHTYDIGMGLYNDQQQLLAVFDEETREMVGGAAYTANDHRFYQKIASFGEELPYGDYYLYPVCRQTGGETWNKAAGSNINHIVATVNGADITLRQANDLSVTVSQTSQGSGSYTTTATLTNNGTEEYNDELFIYVDGSLKDYIEPIVPAGGTTTVTISDYTYATGSSHTLKICGGIYNDGTLYTVTYYANSSIPKLALSHQWNNHISDGKLYGDTYNYELTAANMGNAVFSGNITATLYDATKSASTGITQSQSANIAAGASATLPFTFTNLTPGTTYYLQLTYTDSEAHEVVLGNGDGHAYTITKGIVAIGDEGDKYMSDSGSDFQVSDDAIYVDARYSDNVAAIVAGNNPNTLYLLAAGSSIPSNLSGKNVVVGTTAEEIHLTDGYSFRSPIDFTANTISYERTFNTGNDGTTTHWSTIVLPFKVTSVTNATDEKSIDWFHSSSDKGKNFWVMAFSGDDGTDVSFDYAESMEACQPYIITVAGNTWGEKWNLVGKRLVFTGQNAVITGGKKKGVTDKGGRFDFIGRSWKTDRANIYCLNNEGTWFDRQESNSNVDAFRAYFTGYYDNSTKAKAKILIGQPTGLTEISDDGTAPASNDAVYDMQGRKIGRQQHISSLPRGIYIVNGKKIIK